MKRFLAILLLILFLLLGCVQQSQTNNSLVSDNIPSSPSSLCVVACKSLVASGVDLSNGPCMGIVSDDWVCDVAHSPRLPVDDLSENQCADFARGKAHHFVEVDENCIVLKVY